MVLLRIIEVAEAEKMGREYINSIKLGFHEYSEAERQAFNEKGSGYKVTDALARVSPDNEWVKILLESRDVAVRKRILAEIEKKRGR